MNFSNEVAIQQLEQRLRNMSIDLESANEQINQFKLQILELMKRSDVPSDFEEFKKQVNDSLKLLSSAHENHQSRSVSASNTMKFMHEKLDKIHGLHSDHSQDIVYLKGCFEGIKDDLLGRIDAMATVNGKAISALKEKYVQEMGDLRAKVEATPATVLSSNEDVLKKLEIAMLEASNAMLKVNNTDTNIRILDRKIENALQLVKKMDLEKQAQ